MGAHVVIPVQMWHMAGFGVALFLGELMIATQEWQMLRIL